MKTFSAEGQSRNRSDTQTVLNNLCDCDCVKYSIAFSLLLTITFQFMQWKTEK